jgi:hypothetical protein
MPRFILEAEWTGYRSAQDRCVHREVIKADRAKRLAAPNAIRSVQFTDGTTLTITVREAKPREKVEERFAYVSLIREAEAQGRNFVRVADLPSTNEAA